MPILKFFYFFQLESINQMMSQAQLPTDRHSKPLLSTQGTTTTTTTTTATTTAATTATPEKENRHSKPIPIMLQNHHNNHNHHSYHPQDIIPTRQMADVPIESPPSKRSSRLSIFRRLSIAASSSQYEQESSSELSQHRLSKKQSIASCNSDTSSTATKPSILRPLFNRSRSSILSEKCDPSLLTPQSFQSSSFQQNYLFAKSTTQQPTQKTTIDDFADSDSEEDEEDQKVEGSDTLVGRIDPIIESLDATTKAKHICVFEEEFDDDDDEDDNDITNEDIESVTSERPRLSLDTNITRSRERLDNMKSVINGSCEFLGSSLYLPDNIINENEEQPSSPMTDKEQQQQKQQPKESVSPISSVANSVISTTQSPKGKSPDSYSAHISFKENSPSPSRTRSSIPETILEPSLERTSSAKVSRHGSLLNKKYLEEPTRISTFSLAASSSSCVDKENKPAQENVSQSQMNSTGNIKHVQQQQQQQHHQAAVKRLLVRNWIKKVFLSQPTTKNFNTISVN